MAGPWEKYRQTGPWARYAQQPAKSPEPTSSLEDFIAGTGDFAEPGSAPAPAPAMPVESQNVPLEDFLASDPSTLDQLGRAAQTNLQAVGRGLANIAGAPMDLTGAAIDLGLFGLEKAANTVLPEPVELPRLGQMPLGSQHLKDSAGDLMAALGVDPIERENMHRSERFTGDALEFGTEATVAGLGLKKMADARFPGGNTKGVTPRTGDAFLAPYVGRGTAPVATDTAAGVGAGIGYNFADEEFPENDEAKLIAMLLGGAGGAVASDVPGMVSGTVSAIDGMRPSNAPYGEGGLAPVSKRTIQHTRNFLEEALTDPEAARNAVKSRFEESQRTGDAMPTTGIASDDIGLVALEKGSRVKNPVPFEEADQRLVDSAQQKITGLRDPDADMGAVRQEVQSRPAQLASDRDARALPLLQQAEQSGAVINPQPVADKIDSVLAQAKRPAVVNAMNEARRMLNRTGSEELDTTVSGLYETRKAINDIIEGRGDNPTGRYAKKELIEVRNVLDEELEKAVPEFRQYLDEYRSGSRPLDVFADSEAVKKLAETDPRNVAKKVLSGSEYGTENILKEVNEALKANPDAQRGWKAAVADVLVDKVTNTNTAITRSTEGPVSIAKMQRVWKQHEKDLANIFTPEEMAAANRAHEILEPLGNLARKSTTGSPTATNQQLTNALEAGVLAYTGNAIQTGMIMRRLKVAANLIPGAQDLTLESKMGKLIERMWFDPELFIHVMDQPVKQGADKSWNKRLNKLIAGAEYVKADEEPSEDEQLQNMIMEGAQ